MIEVVGYSISVEEEKSLAKLKIQYEGGPSTTSVGSNKRNLLDALSSSEVVVKPAVSTRYTHVFPFFVIWHTMIYTCILH